MASASARGLLNISSSNRSAPAVFTWLKRLKMETGPVFSREVLGFRLASADRPSKTAIGGGRMRAVGADTGAEASPEFFSLLIMTYAMPVNRRDPFFQLVCIHRVDFLHPRRQVQGADARLSCLQYLPSLDDMRRDH